MAVKKLSGCEQSLLRLKNHFHFFANLGSAAMAIAEFIVETNYPSRRIIRLRRIIHPSINSVLRRIMEQNSSEADSSVSTSSRRANRRTIRLRRDYPSQKFISRRKADGSLTQFPHERDWFLYSKNPHIRT